MRKYICIDIGGTEIKHGVLNEEEQFLTKGKTPTQAWKGGPSLLEKAVGIVADYLREWKAEGICVSTAGMVDVEKGEKFYSGPLIPNNAGTKIKARMEAEFGLPCQVENDVNCAGLAEARSGAALGSSPALCLTIGTGIGGCILIGGRVFHGFSGSACEVGYMHMDGSDFQTLGAASILVKKVSAAKNEPEEEWNGYRIFELAKSGDEICAGAIEEMCQVLGKGIANICYVINPQVVVLGGGIMAQEEYLKPRIESAITTYLVSSIREKTRLAFAMHGNDAGMRGAFYHFMERSGRAQGLSEP